MHGTCLLVFQHTNVVHIIETILRDIEEQNDLIRRSQKLRDIQELVCKC